MTRTSRLKTCRRCTRKRKSHSFLWDEFRDPAARYTCPDCGRTFGTERVGWSDEHGCRVFLWPFRPEAAEET